MNACQNVFRRSFLGLVLAAALAGCAAPPPAAREVWSAAWGTAMLAQPVPQAGAKPVPAPWRQPMRDVSLRQIVRVTAPGSVLRVRVSNLFGDEPLAIGAASVARVQALDPQPVLDAASVRLLSFGGRRDLTVPAGGEVWSDPVELALPALADLAVQLHVQAGPRQASVHPGSRIRSWAMPGNRARALAWPDAVAQEGWWHLAAVDVRAPKALPVLVATGDSITDGYGVPSGSYQRWTDVLAGRLAAVKREAAVVNTGIGGGRLLREGAGPSLVSRFDRDVLARSGATHAVVMIGVNDLGVSHRGRETTPASRAKLLGEMKAGFADLAQRARAQGVCLIGSTVMPYSGSGYYAPKAENEADRQALNAWLREPGRFDALLDFDALMRDPARPTHLRADVDNDGLHPSLAGYRVMAEAFPVDLLDKRCAKVSGP
ncbi:MULTISPECIES: SGNH/GDSL hydrolase family protein [unclassified Roseateles]|uniref:SGNH/GDSL hydrolase family protein n=1 Tax=unclassified Roseateles TaxID=2626991 RepID=UPI0006F55D6B|nr:MULTISPECIES: SGNH/GDSL hydrolase family protein [unclassified Roseateles]KQW46232.1 hypothetical protein ASC81_07390 [Pelomonas sp. Root405]KRA73281.1 hypothetical protein ASD88_07390 [Pelomonas sp. Root662]